MGLSIQIIVSQMEIPMQGERNTYMTFIDDIAYAFVLNFSNRKRFSLVR